MDSAKDQHSNVIYYNNMEKEMIFPVNPKDYPHKTNFYLPETFLIQNGIYEIDDQNYPLFKLGLYEIYKKDETGVVKPYYFMVFDVFDTKSIVSSLLWRLAVHDRKDTTLKKNMINDITWRKIDCLPVDIFRKYVLFLNYPMRYLYAYSHKDKKIINTFLEIWDVSRKKWDMFDIDNGFTFETASFADIIINKNDCREVLRLGKKTAPANRPIDFMYQAQIDSNYDFLADMLTQEDVILAYECVQDNVLVFTADTELISQKKPKRLYDADRLLMGRGLQYRDIANLQYELYEKKQTFIFTSAIIVANEFNDKKEVEE